MDTNPRVRSAARLLNNCFPRTPAETRARMLRAWSHSGLSLIECRTAIREAPAVTLPAYVEPVTVEAAANILNREFWGNMPITRAAMLRAFNIRRPGPVRSYRQLILDSEYRLRGPRPGGGK